ncbi:MAG: hypothetical protein M1829_002183 [Trizodia sp. TS-e1964]|nr:MAG: hypothetical protein M1829_002183 [Trizodia sp. TS-e1964]
MVYSDQFQDFPEPVAKKLRQGSHYTNVWVNPLKALKCYQQALQEAHNLNMDPHSEQVFRIKMQIAALLEKNQLYHKAIEVLDFVRKDNLKWDELEGCKKGNEAKRRRVMDNTVRISAKLADLYTNSFVMENEAAEELLIWIVTTVTKERKRREAEGPIEGEAKWLSNEEVGAAYEVNNLSISLAQQDPPAQPGIAPVSRAALIASARSWAQQALTKAANITPPDRTSECDIGCAVATHNLGEFAEMEGNLDEARKMYEEARSLARAIRFEEGVENAAEGLRRVLDKKES